MVTSLTLLVAFLIYPLLLVLVGRVVGRRADNDTFFTGNRQQPWYLVWPAMISAAMSGITFASVPGSVAADGFTYLQMVMGFTVGQLLIAFWLVPLFYRLRVRSIYQYFEARFGLEAHRAAGGCFVVAKLLSAALKLYIVVLMLQQLVCNGLGLPYWCNALATVIVVWAYTRAGGVKTLLRTDLIKTAVMVTAIVGAVVALLGAIPNETLGEVAASSPYTDIFCWDPHSDRYFWKMFASGVLLLLAMTGLDQDLMQRNLACRSVADARKNVLLTAISQVVVISLLLVLGMLLYGYADRVGLVRPERADLLFAEVAISGGLPWWVALLFVLGFSAGSFSSGGSALTALTTTVVIDLFPDRVRSEEALTRLRRRVHALLAVALLLLLLLFGRWGDQSVINLIYKVAGYTYGPLLGMFLFGQFSRRRVAGRAIVVAVLSAPLLSVVAQWVATTCFGQPIGFELLLLNALLTVALMRLMSRSS